MVHNDLYHQLRQDADRAGISATVVGLLVFRESHILLLKRRPDDFMPDVWEIPGGHVDAGESIPMALTRELEEETGLALHRIVQFIDTFDYPGEFGQTRQWNFEVEVLPRTDLIHPEHVAYLWASSTDLEVLCMTSEERRTVEHYFAWKTMNTPPSLKTPSD